MSLRTVALKIAAELELGDPTRRKLLAALERTAGWVPPTDPVEMAAFRDDLVTHLRRHGLQRIRAGGAPNEVGMFTSHFTIHDFGLQVPATRQLKRPISARTEQDWMRQARKILAAILMSG